MYTTIAQIWQAYHAPLHRFIQRRVGETAVADDILQEVFLRVLTRLETLHDPQKLRSWLYHITRHAISDYYRTHQPWYELSENLRTPVPEDATEARQDLAHCLPPLMQALPEAYRDALLLSDMSGQPQRHVAAQQGLSVSGVKSRVQRGRAMLRALLERCCQVALDHRGTVVAYEPHGSCDVSRCAPVQ
jgi:RNA polymerase sigma-70 factor (ECF subfamily)